MDRSDEQRLLDNARVKNSLDMIYQKSDRAHAFWSGFLTAIIIVSIFIAIFLKLVE